VLDSNGQGTDSSVIAAIDRAVELKDIYNIRVLNLSLGRTIRETYALDPLCQAVERAWRAGIVVVVAAGNNGRDNSMGTSGYSTITSPGNHPYVITVGAMKDRSTVARGDDEIASYSSKGPTLLDQVVKPDLVAPGNGIISSIQPQLYRERELRREPGPDCLLQERQYQPFLLLVLPSERHQHGRSDGLRRGRPDAAKRSRPHPGPGQGTPHEDRD
jgi:serine protease AprX